MAGTGTDVGKTWVSCQLAVQLQERGLIVSARKPAQSFAPGTTGKTDAELLAEATGESAAAVCPPPRWYPKAMAPPMAAEALGLAMPGLQELVGQLWWPAGAHVGLVEQAGGLGSPQAWDGDGIDMVKELGPDRTVVVSGAGLGALGPLRLAARAMGGSPFIVFLNGYDPTDELHVANRRWLVDNWGLTVVVRPYELAEDLLQ